VLSPSALQLAKTAQLLQRLPSQWLGHRRPLRQKDGPPLPPLTLVSRWMVDQALMVRLAMVEWRARNGKGPAAPAQEAVSFSGDLNDIPKLLGSVKVIPPDSPLRQRFKKLIDLRKRIHPGSVD
jgi:hypothetical protein